MIMLRSVQRRDVRDRKRSERNDGRVVHARGMALKKYCALPCELARCRGCRHSGTQAASGVRLRREGGRSARVVGLALFASASICGSAGKQMLLFPSARPRTAKGEVASDESAAAKAAATAGAVEVASTAG